jgi:hypothetical protein
VFAVALVALVASVALAELVASVATLARSPSPEATHRRGVVGPRVEVGATVLTALCVAVVSALGGTCSVAISSLGVLAAASPTTPAASIDGAHARSRPSRSPTRSPFALRADELCG